jgi:uncharacterized membrane protein YcfT
MQARKVYAIRRITYVIGKICGEDLAGLIQRHTAAVWYYYFKAIWPEINNLSAIHLTFLKLFVYLSTESVD